MLPLEDRIGDIIGKAQKGLGITNDLLMRRADLSLGQLRSLKAGRRTEEVLVRRVAGVLGLGEDALVGAAVGAWYPQQPEMPLGGRMFTTPFHDMTVNAFLAWDRETRRAVAIDTGTDAAEMLEWARQQGLGIELVLLTHAHMDHVAALPQLLAATGAVGWINERDRDEEDFPQRVQTFSVGQSFVVGGLRIETLAAGGHSLGQTAYLVRGLGRGVAVVGDALFAGSMGGGVISYGDQVRHTRENILSLPEETLLVCGHGPMTTVGQERRHNPFFAA